MAVNWAGKKSYKNVDVWYAFIECSLFIVLTVGLYHPSDFFVPALSNHMERKMETKQAG